MSKTPDIDIADFTAADRRIWAIAGPAMLANISAPLVGLVDTWAIGHIPDPKHLAAIGVGATLFTFILWSFGFLRMGTTSLVAQAKGADVPANLITWQITQQIAGHVVRALTVGLLIGVILLACQGPLFALGVWALSPPDDVRGPLADYVDIRMLSVPFTLMTYAIIGQLIGEARARAALALQLLLNIANGVLNLVFVLGFGMGVAGIALGTVLAEGLTFLLGLYLIMRGGRLAALLAVMRTQLFDQSQIKRLFKVNGMLFIRTLMLITAFALVTEQAARLGTVALAASQVLNTYLLLISLGLDAFAYAAEALVGQAYGRGSRPIFRFWVRRTGLWALVTAFVYAALFWAGGNVITSQLTSIDSVRLAIDGAMWVLVLLPVIGVASYHFDGVYIGAGATASMAGTMALSCTGFVLALGPFADHFGIAGIWAAVGVLLTLRGLTQGIWYPRIEPKAETREYPQ